MPHADDNNTMSQTQVVTNGETKSQFISHVKSYPVVSDGIETIQSYPLGAKSIEIADATYTRVGNTLEPHLRTPYSYAKPYVNKVDSLADAALNSVDNTFPIVKKDTSTIFDTIKGLVFWPLVKANDGKNYVVDTYFDEYNKTVKRNNRGAGPVTFTLAGISTTMRITSDSLQFAADLLADRSQDAKKKKDDWVSQAKQKKDSYAEKAHQTAQGN